MLLHNNPGFSRAEMGHRGKEGRRVQRQGLWRTFRQECILFLQMFVVLHVVESYGKKKLEFGGLLIR